MASKLTYRDLPGSALYSNLRIPALKQLCKERRLHISGSKTVLIERLLQQDTQNAEQVAPSAPDVSPAPGSDSSIPLVHNPGETGNMGVPAPVPAVSPRVRQRSRKRSTSADNLQSANKSRPSVDFSLSTTPRPVASPVQGHSRDEQSAVPVLSDAPIQECDRNASTAAVLPVPAARFLVDLVDSPLLSQPTGPAISVAPARGNKPTRRKSGAYSRSYSGAPEARGRAGAPAPGLALSSAPAPTALPARQQESENKTIVAPPDRKASAPAPAAAETELSKKTRKKKERTHVADVHAAPATVSRTVSASPPPDAKTRSAPAQPAPSLAAVESALPKKTREQKERTRAADVQPALEAPIRQASVPIPRDDAAASPPVPVQMKGRRTKRVSAANRPPDAPRSSDVAKTTETQDNGSTMPDTGTRDNGNTMPDTGTRDDGNTMLDTGTRDNGNTMQNTGTRDNGNTMPDTGTQNNGALSGEPTSVNDVEMEDAAVPHPSLPTQVRAGTRTEDPPVHKQRRREDVECIDVDVNEFVPRRAAMQLTQKKRTVDIDHGEGSLGAPPASRRRVAADCFDGRANNGEGESGAPPASRRQSKQKERKSNNAEHDKSSGPGRGTSKQKQKTASQDAELQKVFFVKDENDGARIKRSSEKADLSIIDSMSRHASQIMRDEYSKEIGDPVLLSNDVQFVMADLLKYFYQKVMDRAASLATFTKHTKITQRHVQAAMQICMGGAVVNNLQEAGLRRVERFHELRKVRQP